MQDHTQNLNWKMITKAGEGVMLASKLFAKLCKRSGLEVFNYYEYPSLIKGGQQSGQVYASQNQAHCQHRRLDLLVLLHEKFLAEHLEELDEKSLVLINAKNFNASSYPQLQSTVLALPITQLARKTTGDTQASNMIALGASACLSGLSIKILEQVIKDEFVTKTAVIDKNLKALTVGCQEAMTLMKEQDINPVLPTFTKGQDDKLLLTGNEAVGLGAMAAGLQFYSAYPMTPASGLLHYLAARQHDYPLVVKHSEDEIAAINQALGASFAGVRAMTGSSGGGYALMVEATSLSGVAEIPLVILEAMRQGPATGLPTWTSQADLSFIVNAGHGDFTKVVLTPGDVLEHYQLTRVAFELAECYQLPVFILSDKYLLESHQTMSRPETKQSNPRFSLLAEDKQPGLDYQRYQDTSDGISPRAIPGIHQAIQLTNSYDHDVYGFATEEAVITKQAVDKRAKKLKSLMKDLPQPVVLGASNKQAKRVLLSYGSTVNVLRDLLLNYPTLAKTTRVIHLPCVAPLPSQALLKALDLEQINSKKQQLFTIEGNATGQLASLIKAQLPIQHLQSILRYDGRPFYSEDLAQFLLKGRLADQYQLR